MHSCVCLWAIVFMLLFLLLQVLCSNNSQNGCDNYNAVQLGRHHCIWQLHIIHSHWHGKFGRRKLILTSFGGVVVRASNLVIVSQRPPYNHLPTATYIPHAHHHGTFWLYMCLDGYFYLPPPTRNQRKNSGADKRSCFNPTFPPPGLANA